MSGRGYDTIQAFSLSLSPKSASKLQQTSAHANQHQHFSRPILSSMKLSETRSQRCVMQNAGKQQTLGGNAWVEVQFPVDNYVQREEQIANWERAKLLNDFLAAEQTRKSQRLLQFQQEVKCRVKQLQDKKQQELLKKSYRSVELERSVARKTAFLAQACLPNASDVIVHGRHDTIVKPGDGPNFATGPEAYQEENLHAILETMKDMEKERLMKQTARQKLVSRQLLAQQTQKPLPGSLWHEESFTEKTVEEDNCLLNVHEGYQNNEWATNASVVPSSSSPEREDAGKMESQPCSDTSMLATHIISGQDDEEVRKQEIKQRALLRKLFMDIEREQVKEYSKTKKHQQIIFQLKQAKEEERRRQELMAERDLIPTLKHPSPDSSAEQLQTDKDLLQREKEAKRYIKALRSMLKEKMKRQGINVPLLCSCGDTIWDTHPDLCANNCTFYKNPKDYLRAMHTLLSSCDVSWD